MTDSCSLPPPPRRAAARPRLADEDGQALVVAIACEDGPEGLRRRLAQGRRSAERAAPARRRRMSLSPASRRSTATARAGGHCRSRPAVAATAPSHSPPSAEEELRAFCGLFARRRPIEGGLRVGARALRARLRPRGPGRSGSADHLLALRALLVKPGGRAAAASPAGSRRSARFRGARAMTERVARAISLEASLISGVAPRGEAAMLAGKLEQALRALLRDVLCSSSTHDLVGSPTAHTVPSPPVSRGQRAARASSPSRRRRTHLVEPGRHPRRGAGSSAARHGGTLALLSAPEPGAAREPAGGG